LQDYAIGILQLNASSPSRNGPASSDRAVSAFNRSRSFQVKGPPDELRCRSTDRKPDAHTRYGEWIALASEDQHALAAADSDDEPALREYDGDLTGFSPRWCAESSHAYEQGNQGRVYTKIVKGQDAVTARVTRRHGVTFQRSQYRICSTQPIPNLFNTANTEFVMPGSANWFLHATAEAGRSQMFALRLSKRNGPLSRAGRQRRQGWRRRRIIDDRDRRLVAHQAAWT
jgi:hypothetical protein